LGGNLRYVGRVEELRGCYEANSERLEDWLVEFEIPRWYSGDVLRDFFGSDGDALDVICLLASLARSVPLNISEQIGHALDEGHSWNEIAAALGVSRQAAVKRYG
jgi:hypothetical protein